MLAQHMIVSKQRYGYRYTQAGMPVSKPLAHILSPWNSPLAGFKDMTQPPLCCIS